MQNITGIKIRRLREDLGITQEELANSIGLSHEFISLLELEKRDPSLENLSKLARFFGKNLAYFLSDKEDEFDILLRSKNKPDNFKKEIRSFKTYCKQYLALEDKNEHALNLAPLYTNVTASQMAEEERRRLGLGGNPCLNVFLLLEHNGLRILKKYISPEMNIAGIFVFLERKQAAFALINNLYSPEQQILAAVHLYGHYLKDRHDGPVVDNSDIFIKEYSSLYPVREQFAQTFAANFLMPETKIKDLIKRLFYSANLNYADILYIKHYFGVPLDVVLNRLFELGHLSRSEINKHKKKNSLNWEKTLYGRHDTKTSKKKTKEYSDRFINLCYRAFEKEKITREELVNLLGIRKDRFPF